MLIEKIIPVQSRSRLLEVSPSQLRPHPELLDLRNAMSDEDDKNLEVSIRQYGIRDTLRVFRDESDNDHFFILDGHNIWQKAIKLNISKLRIEICHFPSIGHAQLDYIDRKLARGHLTQRERVHLALKQNEIEDNLARQHQSKGGTRSGLMRSRTAKRNSDGTFSVSNQSVHPVTDTLVTRRGSLARLGKNVNLSESTLQRAKAVKREDPEEYQRYIRGEVKLRDAYRAVQRRQLHSKSPLTGVEHTTWKRHIRQESWQIKALLKTWEEMDKALQTITSEGARELRKLSPDLSKEPRLLIHVAREHLKEIDKSPYTNVASRTPSLYLVKATSH